jgi:shikimate O-hydroxycinnamoyltransferase
MPKLESTLVSQTILKGGVTCPRQYLTGVDIFNTHTGIPITLVYDKGLDIAAMQRSLIEQIKLQPPMAGRIRTDEEGLPYIDGNDGGVVFRVHRAKGHMPRFGPTNHMAESLKHYAKPIFPWKVVNKDTALFHFDVHQFECGGAVLCVTGIHSLYDGAMFWHFMKQWADATRGQGVAAPVDFDRSKLIQIGQDHIDLPYTAGQVYEMGLLKRLSVYARFAWQLFTSLEKGVFRIPASTIEAWKAQARAELPPEHPGLSTSDLVTLHVLKEISPVMWCDKDRCVGIVIDLRYKRRLRLPRHFFGNALGQAEVRYTKAELERDSLTQLAARFKPPAESVSDQTFTSFLAMMERLRRSKKIGTLMMKTAGDTLEAGLVLNNCAHFSTYEIDFGTGTPCWHDNAKVVYRMLMLCPTPERDGGMDIHLTARKEEVAVFRKRYAGS